MFLILFAKQNLKIQIFLDISEMEITSKIFFLSKLFIFFYFDSTNNIVANRDKRTFSYKKIKTLVIF